MLDVRNIEVRYGRTTAVRDVSFSVAPGEFVCIVGPNGAGKSTTMMTVAGTLKPASGSIALNGEPIAGLVPEQIARRGISLVPEGRQIFPNLNVRENLVATATRGTWDLKRVYDLFPRLAEREGSMGNQLSGGEQQMLAVGRALMTNPRLLILDEATEGLAPLIRAEIWRCLESLKASGLAILVIDKNVGMLTRVADRHFLIERGRVVWSGASAALAAAPEVQHRYLGV